MRIPVLTATDGSAPYVELELVGRRGLFLIDYGASQSVIEEGVWHLPPKPGPRWSTLKTPDGAVIDLVSMGPHTVPGWTKVQMLSFQVDDRNLTVAGHGEQVGVLGVGDLLFNQSAEFHYEDPADQHVVISDFGANCPTAALTAAGLRRIGQQGHWQQGNQAPNGVHNGPVAYVSFAAADAAGTPLGIRTFAQIDTGLDDTVWPRTIIINRPLLDRLKASRTPPVLRDSAEIKDCKGNKQRQEVYILPGHVVRIEDESGAQLRRVAQFHLLFQSAAPGCHGISGHAQPAAQLGASFLREFGTTIFLGQRSEVWMRPDPGGAR
ncbi:MAG TPA: hypothetical protein VK539_17345 [Myxococcaceae bacterium]|nr:hypothetical protein [Myxococcaceae bacterium]